MPKEIQGRDYYRVTEVCKSVGISRATLFRWIAAGIIRDAAKRDRIGWRLFSSEEVEKIKAEAQKISTK